MSYTTLIPLESAKSYLGVDDTSRDTEIERMVKASIRYVEKATNHILEAQDKTYNLTNGCVRVYDFPINTDSDNLFKQSTFYNYIDDVEDITLNIGYTSDDDVPEDLKEAIYWKLGVLFFGQEGVNETQELIDITIDHYRRFII